LQGASRRVSLTEGDSTGVSLNLALQRDSGERRAVDLSINAVGVRDGRDIRYVFSSSTLQADQSGSVLTLHLDVGVAPLLPHERHLQVVADDGQARSYLDVEVGSRQGYEGGLDERHPRIHQLNVLPNNRSLFYNDAFFRDERSNVSTPTFVPAEDPLHEPRFIGIDGKEASFVGLGLTFAKSAVATSTADVYLVPAAWGATGFCANSNGDLAWNAEATPNETFLGGTLLTERALTRMNMTLRETGGILRGILWHQGGADSNNPDCSRTYAQNLTKLASRLRREARVDARGEGARGETAVIPFVVATQSRGDDNRGNFSNFSVAKQQVDRAQRTVANYIEHADFVNNDDLIPPQYPCGQVSCVHFGAEALREQGRRYFAAMKRIWSSAGAFHF